MRYLPLTDTDRGAMLAKIGASSIDDLFVDVPEEARLSGPIAGLPMHAKPAASKPGMGNPPRQRAAKGQPGNSARIVAPDDDEAAAEGTFLNPLTQGPHAKCKNLKLKSSNILSAYG